MSSIDISPRTNRWSLALPPEDVAQFLPAAVRSAIEEASLAAKRATEVSTVLNDGERLLSEARRRDVTERADEVGADRKDPGPRHTIAAQSTLDEAARVLPIAEELHRRAVVNIQRVAQALPDKALIEMATSVVKRHRKFIEATEAAEVSYGDEVRSRGCLEFLVALRNNEPIGRRGSVQLLDTVRYFDTIRTALSTKDGIETTLYSWDNRVRKPQRVDGGPDNVDVVPDQDQADEDA